VMGATVGHTLISSVNGMWVGFWFIAFMVLTISTESKPRSA
jgi:hypothetical protein